VIPLVEPTLPDVLAAAARIRPYLAPTPLRHSPAVSEIEGADVYLKHEFHLPTGAFKVRGGVNLVSQLSAREREGGVIAASTGNHGQSVAYAAKLFGGSAAGACIVANAVNPGIAVIGVQAEKAPSAYLSWRAGKPINTTTSTWAEGLATRTPFELPPRILRRLLDDFILVSEEAISAAVRFLLARNRILVEGAGASSLAAALALKDRLAGKRVALILTGGNISIPQLKAVLDGA
jgi:threonine dehydratase